MQELSEPGILETLSLEIFSIMQLCVINESLFPNLRTLEFRVPKGSFFSIRLLISFAYNHRHQSHIR